MTSFMELLDGNAQRALMEGAVRRHFEEGEDLFTEGLEADRLVIIRLGTARIFKDHLGTRVPIGRIGVGEVLGELSFLDRQPASANVVAEEHVEADVLDGSALRNRLASDVELGRVVYRALAETLAGRLRTTDVARAAVPVLGIG